MYYVVSIGGGLTSTVFLPEMMLDRYGKKAVTFVMAKLPNEDPDVWKLCHAVEQYYGITIEYIGKNLTPWDVFFKERFLGNSRIDPCSKNLKREVLKEYMKRFEPAQTKLAVGISWDEVHRMKDITSRWAMIGFDVIAPLVTDFRLTREEQQAECEKRFGFVPRLYKWGFAHNNCGGACIKAGMREWARLLWYLPDVFEWWQEGEELFQATVGNYTILRETKQGIRYSLPLKTFKLRCLSAWTGCSKDTPFELLPKVKDLAPSTACTACSAA